MLVFNAATCFCMVSLDIPCSEGGVCLCMCNISNQCTSNWQSITRPGLVGVLYTGSARPSLLFLLVRVCEWG